MTTTSDARKRLAEKNEQPTTASVVVPAVLPERFPRVTGRCPACGRSSLMLAAGGYVTCASLSCRDPEAASNMLAPRPEPVADRDEWCREESCKWRHWRSGSMPTHRRGGDCPEPVADPLPSEAVDEGDAVSAIVEGRRRVLIRDSDDPDGLVWNDGMTHYRHADLSDVRRLVPEGDEDTVREWIITALHDSLEELHDGEHPEGTCALCDWAGSIPDIVNGAGS